VSGLRKKRLLYASPFPPMKSGISDYSEILIYGLKNHFEITLLIDDYRLENQKLYEDFKVKVYKKDPLVFSLFDFWIYNIGNNPYFHSYIYEAARKKPGLIILHDFVAYYLTIGVYREKGILYSKIYEMAGAAGINLIKRYTKGQEDLLECKKLAVKLPLNRELINSENKIMVHSDYAYERVSKVINNISRLRKINQIDQISEKEDLIPKARLFRQYCIPEDVFIISSFGNIDTTKLNHVVADTIDMLDGASGKKIMYLMVGEGDYIDSYLSSNIKKTGRVSLREFDSFIKHSDIVVNLRHPSMGETSAAVIRTLGLGKPCIVSNDAWFSELPDDVVVKLNNKNIQEELYDSLLRFIENPDRMKKISRTAKEYIQNKHSVARISNQIADFLRH
jgi:glycosyltransferase involved in cell wall biosynthesis